MPQEPVLLARKAEHAQKVAELVENLCRRKKNSKEIGLWVTKNENGGASPATSELTTATKA
jgi:hypothetical protein